MTIENIGTDTSGLKRPILANLVVVDARNHPRHDSMFQVAVEGDEFFYDEDRIGVDLIEFGRAVSRAVEETTRFDLNFVQLLDFDVENAPQVNWDITSGADDGTGTYHTVTQASCDAIAVAKGALNREFANRLSEPVSIEVRTADAAASLADQAFQPPVPMVADGAWLSVACDLLAEHADDYSTIKDVDDVFFWSSNRARRGPEHAEGDFLITFASSDAKAGDRLTVIVPNNVFEHEVCDLAGREVEQDTLRSFLTEKFEAVAHRYVDRQSPAGSSSYRDRLNAAVENLSIVDMGRTGTLLNYDVDAVYYGLSEEGVFQGSVQAVDSEDAVFQATLIMSGAKSLKGRKAIEMLDRHFGAHEMEVVHVAYDFDRTGPLLEQLAASKTAFPSAVRAMLDEYVDKLETFETVMANRTVPHVPGSAMEAVRAPTI